MRWRLSEQAAIDELEVWLHIAQDSYDNADRMMDRLKQVYRRLGEFPLSGRERPELGHGLRSVSAGNYLVVYRVTEKHIEIARIVHGMRDLPRLFGENP